jgi:thioredoxin-related protein
MFLLASKKYKISLWFLAASLSLVWIIESTAAGLFDYEESAKAQGSLPYVVLKEGANLAGDGSEASEKQIPILMFFSMEHCPYCMEVEEDYLKPMLRNSEYDSKVLIRKIRLDGENVVKDFAGAERDPGEFSDEYNVSMVPTLILVDSRGKKIAPPIIGIRNSHYYSSELDDAIDASTRILREIAKR